LEKCLPTLSKGEEDAKPREGSLKIVSIVFNLLLQFVDDMKELACRKGK